MATESLPRRSKHGESNGGANTPEYRAYNGAKARCSNLSLKDYGGRGIEFRFTSYEQFLNHIGRRPTDQHSLDRIDTNGHYELGNVRWATDLEQARNKRNNHQITYQGETLTAVEWSERLGKNRRLVGCRLSKDWCETCAVSIPVGSGYYDLQPTCPHREGRPVRVRASRAAKLTEQQVRAIRRDTRSHAAIARDYSVIAETIRMIKTGRSWQWLSDDAAALAKADAALKGVE